MAYNYNKNLRIPFDEVIDKIQENLQAQGFNIIHIFDMKEDLKNNLEVGFRNYKILTACHTVLGYKAMSLEPHIGLLLPCNILVQEHENGEVEVSAMNPLESIDKNMVTASLEFVAGKISDHLRTAVDSLYLKSDHFSFTYN